jgi:hypothetical protein
LDASSPSSPSSGGMSSTVASSATPKNKIKIDKVKDQGCYASKQECTLKYSTFSRSYIQCLANEN